MSYLIDRFHCIDGYSHGNKKVINAGQEDKSDSALVVHFMAGIINVCKSTIINYKA